MSLYLNSFIDMQPHYSETYDFINKFNHSVALFFNNINTTNKMIRNEIKTMKANPEMVAKILVLGIGGAGKSTVIQRSIQFTMSQPLMKTPKNSLQSIF